MKAGYEKTTQTLGKVGTGLSTAGVACGMVGQALSSMGLDGAAQAFETLGTILTTVGGVTSVFSTILGFL